MWSKTSLGSIVNKFTLMSSFELDHPLIEFKSSLGSSFWNIRNAVEGVQIFGGIGSGKTSGSGRFLALKYLNNGFGGLVLTAKPDEKKLWIEYATLTNRVKDLIIVEPRNLNRFNFLTYESQKSTNSDELATNLVQILKVVINTSDSRERSSGKDPFWDSALDLLLYNSIELCMLAYGKVDVRLLYDIVQNAPRDQNLTLEKVLSEGNSFSLAMNKAFQLADTKRAEWLAQHSEEEIVEMEQEDILDFRVAEEVPEVNTYLRIELFFLKTYLQLSEKTRSVIDFSFTSFLYHLLKEPVYSLFAKGESTFTPDDSLRGKIIVLNLPTKTFDKVGKDCQIMFKYIWQRAMERRDIKKNDVRPVFLWADEAQNFIHEHDAEYQATARSSRIATVYLTQNLSNYYSNMGGSHSEHRVKSFLGTLNTKFFHANADVETNRYAADLMGEEYKDSKTLSETISGAFSFGSSTTKKLEKWVRPEKFMRLRTGGPENNLVVEAYMHKVGNPLENGLNFSKRKFNQNYTPN